ncbi:MAG: hypothetical protein WC837_11395 [Bellilinea sp.]
MPNILFHKIKMGRRQGQNRNIELLARQVGLEVQELPPHNPAFNFLLVIES